MNNEAKESKDSREVKVAKETREFEGKKLLILGGNPETIPLVEIANNWGIKTIVVSARHTDPAKAYAWKAYDFEGLDTGAVIKIATEEKVDGVLVGVADILVQKNRVSPPQAQTFCLEPFVDRSVQHV